MIVPVAFGAAWTSGFCRKSGAYTRSVDQLRKMRSVLPTINFGAGNEATTYAVEHAFRFSEERRAG